MTTSTLEVPQTVARAGAPVLTVYSKPACVMCDATYRALDRADLVKGVDYVSIDVSEDGEAADFVRGLGYLQAPVVTFGEENWSGFRPDLVKFAIDTIKASRADVAA